MGFDPLREYSERKFVNTWTDSEKEIFKEKFLLHPKNFGLIAQSLERKTVPDCVQYYYLSKKTENYKQLLRKSKMGRVEGDSQIILIMPAQMLVQLHKVKLL